MSCNIREYKNDDGMIVTAFVGPEGERMSVQFTIEDKYCRLSESVVWDLIKTLQMRIHCYEGYTATGADREDITYRTTVVSPIHHES